MRVFLWHVHGSYTNSLVQGGHEYLLAVTPDRGPDGLGRARTWSWPANVVEAPATELRHADFDVVVLQRPHEVELLERWTGLRAGVDVPAVYGEHNTPAGHAATTRHPLADRSDIAVAHVTAFHGLM